MIIILIALAVLQAVAADKGAIINGVDAPPDRYPYTVSIQTDLYNDDIFGTNEHNCGGTLIAPDIVLTAAHCVNEPGNLFDIVVTNLYMLSDPLGTSEPFSIDQIELHPFYATLATFDHDFAVIKLNGSSNLSPIRLNSDENTPTVGAPLHVVGWGLSYISFDCFFGDCESPDILQQLNTTAISNEECQDIYIKIYEETVDAEDPVEITPDNICAVSPDDTGICFGDSGGPLVIPGDDPSEDVQVGITSFTFRCTEPSGYARISEEYNWIRYQVCLMSDNPPASFNCNGGVTFSPAPSAAPTAPTASPAPTAEEIAVLLTLDMDSFPRETGWAIEDEFGDEVASIRPGDYRGDDYSHLFFLERGKQFTFILRDSFGNSFYGTAALYLGDEVDEDKILAFFSGSYGPYFGVRHEMPFITDESGIRDAIYPTGTPSAPSEAPSSEPTSPTVSAAPSSPEQSVYVEVNTDVSPEATAWTITASDGQVVYDVQYSTYQSSYTAYGHVVSLIDSQEYELTIVSAYGCGLYGNLTVYLGEEAAIDTVVAHYGSDYDYFSYSITIAFVASDSDTFAVFPTFAPVTPAPTPIPGPNPPCNVCGNSTVNRVTEPEGIFDYSSEMSIRCGELEGNGQEGLISAEYCVLLPDLLVGICGCQMM